MKTILKQIAFYAGTSLIIYFIFKLFFLLTHIRNPAFENILSIPVSLFIGFLLLNGSQKKK